MEYVSSYINILNARYANQRTALMIACGNTNLDLVEELLTYGVDVDLQSDDGFTALMETINSPLGSLSIKLKIVKALIKAGANINIPNHRRVTPLINAAEKDYIDIIKELIDKDPIAAGRLHKYDYGDFYDRLSPKAKEFVDENYPKIAITKQFRQEEDTNFGFIRTNRKLPFADLLNEDYGNGQTLLLKACQSANLDLVKTLLEAGDNIDRQDKDGNTALIHAAKQENLDLIKILIETNAGLFKKNHEEKDFYDCLTVQGIKDWVINNVQDFEKDRQMWRDAEVFGI